MKKLLYLLLAMPLVFAACSNDDADTPEDTTPSVAFDKPLTPIVEGKATLTLVVKNFDMTTMADDEKIEVTVQVGGNAVDKTDYTFSLKTFIMKNKTPRMTLTLTSNNFTEDTKTVELSLVAPEGFKLGKIAKTKLTLSPRKIYYQFESFASEMTDQMKLEVQMINDAGGTKKAEADITIPLKVDASSTAVRGTNFEFEGDKAQLVIPKGKSYGTVIVNMKKFEAGKDKIVLDLGELDGMLIGDPGRTTITMKPSFWDLVAGTYTVESQALTKEWIDKNLYGLVTSFEGFPTLNTADEFTFDIANKKLIPNLKSELKNYFIGESNMVKNKMVQLFDLATMMGEFQVLMIDLDNVNRDFAATTQSSDKHAYIGIRMVKNDAQEDRLELYIIDYVPTTFMLEVLSFGFQTERPTAWMTGSYHLFTLKPKN